MLLENFRNDNSEKFAKINRVLKKQYGATVSESSSIEDVMSVKDAILEKIQQLKITGKAANTCPELSKSLLVLESVESLLERKLNELTAMVQKSPGYLMFIDNCVARVLKDVEVGDDMEDAISQIMKQYRSSQYRYTDVDAETAIRNGVAMGSVVPNAGIESY